MNSRIDTLKQQRADRLELIREQTGMIQSQFAKYLDLEPGSYSDIKRCKNGISQSVLRKLEKKLNINIEWLMHGIGEMAMEPSAEEKENTVASILIPYQKQPEDSVNAYIDRLFKIIERRDDQIEKLMNTIKEFEQDNQKKLNNILLAIETKLTN